MSIYLQLSPPSSRLVMYLEPELQKTSSQNWIAMFQAWYDLEKVGTAILIIAIIIWFIRTTLHMKLEQNEWHEVNRRSEEYERRLNLEIVRQAEEREVERLRIKGAVRQQELRFEKERLKKLSMPKARRKVQYEQIDTESLRNFC